jgi:hypothetical protein
MADDRPKLPQVSLRDGKLYVEGEKEPYFQDRERTLRFRVDALTITRGYQPEEFDEDPTGKKVLFEFLKGTAKLENGRFAVIGLETDSTTPIKFYLRPIADTATEIRLHLVADPQLRSTVFGDNSNAATFAKCVVCRVGFNRGSTLQAH